MLRFLKRLALALFALRLFAPPLEPRFPSPQSAPFRLPARTVFVGDEEFVVRETGPAEAPPLLLIHGLGGSSLAEWYQVAPGLSEEYRVIMVDQRNHGLAPQTRGRTEISDLADDVAGVLDVLGLGSVHAVGFSMGGTVAQQLFQRYPGRVRSLTLIATVDHHEPSWRWSRSAVVWFLRAWERLTGVGASEVRAGYLLATGAVKREHARWLWNETHRRHPDTVAASTWSIVRFDGRGWLERGAPPTAIVIPTRDQLLPSTWQRRLASRIRDVEIVEVDGRHELPWTHPELLIEVIRNTITRTASP